MEWKERQIVARFLTASIATRPGLEDLCSTTKHGPSDLASVKAKFVDNKHNDLELVKRGKKPTPSTPLPSDHGREKYNPFVWLVRVNSSYPLFGMPIFYILDDMSRFIENWLRDMEAGRPMQPSEDASPGVDPLDRPVQNVGDPFEGFRRNHTITQRFGDWNIRVVWINRTGQRWPWLSRGKAPAEVSVVQSVDEKPTSKSVLSRWLFEHMRASLLKFHGLTMVLELNLRDEQGHGVFGLSSHIWRDRDWTEEMERFLSIDARADALVNWGVPQEAPPPPRRPPSQGSVNPAPSRLRDPSQLRKSLPRPRMSIFPSRRG
ncbi:MAG: hypothetical protein M1831_006217 [Alyxoria varia]|nr:MAG: hypothetical protein M1831_006217 [Alyxoria varia]